MSAWRECEEHPQPECACGADRTGVSMYCQCCNMLTTLPHSHPELSPIRCPSLKT
jgi:hypothetical protein